MRLKTSSDDRVGSPHFPNSFSACRRCSWWSRSRNHRESSLLHDQAHNTYAGNEKYPFEFAKTRVQLRNETGGSAPRNPFVVVQQVVKKEGARALYKGCSSLIAVSGDTVHHLISLKQIHPLLFTVKVFSFRPSPDAHQTNRDPLPKMASDSFHSTPSKTPSKIQKPAL